MKYIRKCIQCEQKIIINSTSSYYDSIKRYKNYICKNCRKLNTILNRPKREELFKLCPKCGEKQTYLKRSNLNLAIRKNVECRKCYRKKCLEIKQTEKYIKQCPVCKKELHYPNKTNYIRSIKENSVCRGCIKFIKKYNPKYNPNYNEKACDFMDLINKGKGWNLKHARNNGAEVMILWYYPDGYDKERNIVFEYDEFYHNQPKQKEKDICRMNEIIGHLHCKFYRYNEKTKEFKEYEEKTI